MNYKNSDFSCFCLAFGQLSCRLPFAWLSQARLSLARLSIFFAIGILLATASNSVSAQTNQEKFDEIFSKWKAAGKEASIAVNKYFLATRSEAFEHREVWKKAVEEGNRHMNALVPVALELFQENPTKDLTELLIRIMNSKHEGGVYEKAYEIAELILAHESENEFALYVKLSAALMTDRYEIAKELDEKYPLLRQDLIREAFAILNVIDQMIEDHQKEMELREQEAIAKDLPRAKIKTTKGTIVVELFENEAPDTVGNFVFIAEHNGFTDLLFHRVLNHFMAQAGGFHVSGKRYEVGYRIYDECNKPEARKHFRGSLSMAKTQEPDSGSSQFFITFAATPNLNNRHTVFGRVVSGWDVVDRLNRTHVINAEKMKEDPIPGITQDRILSVTIENKRDHEYLPDRVAQE